MEADPRELEELVLEGQVAKLLSLVTLEQVAAAWCGYHARTHFPGVEDDDPDWWAVDLLLSGEFWSDELRVRTVIDLLVERAPDDRVLGGVGAGPLEDFISDNEDRLVWIEGRAAASARFREALGHVWIWGAWPERARQGRKSRRRRACSADQQGRGRSRRTARHDSHQSERRTCRGDRDRR